MKYVVLGAGGFVGGAMVERLVRQRSAVIPVIRRLGASAALARFGLRPEVADLQNHARLKSALEGADVVFHCVTGDRDTNVDGLSCSLEAARAAGVRRFVYLSSAVVHGTRPRSAVDESSPLNPDSSSEYAKSKAAADKIITRWHKGPETVVLRPSIIFGPRSKYWSEAPARQIAAGTAYLVEHGYGYMNSIYIEHLLDAMLLAAHEPRAANQIYVVQDGFGLTWRDYYKALCDLLEKRLDDIADYSWDDLRCLSRLYKYKQWAKDTPHVMWAALWQDPLKGWLKRAPGFELLRRTVSSNGTVSVTHASKGRSSGPIPELSVALQQTFPQPLVDTKIRNDLGYSPRFSFAEILGRLRLWYRFMGLVGLVH